MSSSRPRQQPTLQAKHPRLISTDTRALLRRRQSRDDSSQHQPELLRGTPFQQLKKKSRKKKKKTDTQESNAAFPCNLQPQPEHSSQRFTAAPSHKFGVRCCGGGCCKIATVETPFLGRLAWSDLIRGRVQVGGTGKKVIPLRLWAVHSSKQSTSDLSLTLLVLDARRAPSRLLYSRGQLLLDSAPVDRRKRRSIHVT